MPEEPQVTYRKEALDHHINANSHDNGLGIVDHKTWLALGLILLIVFSFLIWAFAGRISYWQSGNGIFLPKDGVLVTLEAPDGANAVASIHVKQQQFVRKGDVVAELSNPSLRNEIEVLNAFIAKSESNLSTQIQQSKIELAKRRENIKSQNNLIREIIQSSEKNFAAVKQLLETRKKGLESKITTREKYYSTLNQFYTVKNNLDKSHQTILQNEVSLQEFEDIWRERIRQSENALKDAKKQKGLLVARLESISSIRAPNDGIITAVKKNPGETVTPGEQLVTLTTGRTGLKCIMYLSPDAGKRVVEGDKVLVSPTTYKPEEHGSIIGRVISVSRYPMTLDDMQAVLQNEQIVKQFMEEGPPIAIEVELLEDDNNTSGFKWTSAKGPDAIITAGTVATARVVIDVKTPVSLFVPALKRLFVPYE